MTTITLNGEPFTLEGPTTVAGLLRLQDIRTERVAVEVNRRIVPRSRHEEHQIEAGDVVEIVTFVGGG